ncbi:MAG: nucleoside-diphosphate kinase [Acidobacteria bacterium]|nr:nucleoside-diphosphate kinase [Acidobacteriota bacterium]
MNTEKTLAIIKPDAVRAGKIGPIITMIYESGLAIRAMKMLHLTKWEAEGFYHVHRERTFFNDLTSFMSESPIVVMVIEATDAIARWRALMGPTNPAQAEAGTIRAAFGTTIERNAVHGSDSPESAAQEIPYFFNNLEMYPE